MLLWLGGGLPVAKQEILGLEFRFHSGSESKPKIWGARSKKKYGNEKKTSAFTDRQDRQSSKKNDWGDGLQKTKKMYEFLKGCQVKNVDKNWKLRYFLGYLSEEQMNFEKKG